jgi:hypothetical protein
MDMPTPEGVRRYPKTEGWFTPNRLARLWFEPLRAPCTCQYSCTRPYCKGKCGCNACLGLSTQRYFKMTDGEIEKEVGQQLPYFFNDINRPEMLSSFSAKNIHCVRAARNGYLRVLSRLLRMRVV